MKQLVDLLRQLAMVGPPGTAAAARRAAESLQHGVVAASAGPASALGDDHGPRTSAPDVAAGSSAGGPSAPGDGPPGSRGR